MDSGRQTRDLARDQRGQSLLQLLVAMALSTVFLMVFASTMLIAQRSNDMVAKKLARLALEREITQVLARSKACDRIFAMSNLEFPDSIVFNGAGVGPASPHTFPLKSIPGDADPTPIVTSGEVVSSLSNSLQLGPTQSARPGLQIVVWSVNPPMATLNVNFDSSGSTGESMSLAFQIKLKTSLSKGVPQLTTITGCSVGS